MMKQVTQNDLKAFQTSIFARLTGRQTGQSRDFPKRSRDLGHFRPQAALQISLYISSRIKTNIIGLFFDPFFQTTFRVENLNFKAIVEISCKYIRAIVA